MTLTRRWFALVLLGSFALLAVSLRQAFADPPPWAGRGEHNKHYNDDDDDDDWWKQHERDEWKRHPHKYRGEDARCGQILDRMRLDRSKIREIEPTGRHRKALRWYREDLENARHDLYGCRHGG